MKDEKLEVLKAVHSWNGLSKSDIADKVDSSRQNIGQNHLPDLKENGCIEINDNVWPHEVTITDHGKDVLIKNNDGTTRPSSVYNESKSEHRFIHRFVVGFPVQNAFALNSDWRERVIEEVNEEVNYVEDFDEYHFSVDNWQFRISGEFVYVRLREEVRGLHYRQVKDDAIDKAIEGAEFFENLDYIPIKLSKAPASFRIAEQHIGSSGDNLVHAFVKYVDEETEHNVSNWRAYGEEGSDEREVLIWADKSSGELHEESGNGGNPSGSRGRAEDVQAFTEEITEGMISRADKTRELVYNGVERIEGVESKVQQVQKVKQSVESNQESIQSVRSRQDKLLELKNEEREKVDALERLARSNQELLERVVQRLEEEESSSSFNNPVQKIFMETWQDDSYSRPWFDHGHLKAWNLEGDKKSCEVILNKETIECLKR